MMQNGSAEAPAPSNQGKEAEDTQDVQAQGKSMSNKQYKQLQTYIKFLYGSSRKQTDDTALIEELRMTPIFTWDVKVSSGAKASNVFEQFGLLGHIIPEIQEPTPDLLGNTIFEHADKPKPEIQPVFLNTNSPFSVFLCGSQGSGKSHTMSCILENCLYPEPNINMLPQRLSGMVFHYDKTTASIAQPAHLGSHIKVKVLASPSNCGKLTKIYSSLGFVNISIQPLYLEPKHLNSERIMRLMAVSEGSSMPLYMHALIKVLRDMALIGQGKSHFDWNTFKKRINEEDLTPAQKGPLSLRISIIESFMKVDLSKIQANTKTISSAKIADTKSDIFSGEPGTLTIVDLSDPVIDPETACVLFDICLALFVERTSCGKLVALDEAHNVSPFSSTNARTLTPRKYMQATSSSASRFTESILKNVREQRHKAIRVVVATQEPTISPALLDLCSLTMVHRFTSPDWYNMIRKHLAAIQFEEATSSAGRNLDDGPRGTKLLKKIIRLKVGESLLFCPTAALAANHDGHIDRLHESYLHFRTRPRLTHDGGKSKMAMVRR